MTTKEAYRKRLEVRLKEWTPRLDWLKAKARKTTEGVRVKYRNEMESLGTTRTVARNMLDELAKRSLGAWGGLRSRAESAWSKVSRAMEKVLRQ